MKKNLLLVNLGSPEHPSPQAVGTYLREFLNDPFVIDLPQPLRWILVNLLIVPKRKHTSAEAYRSIWTSQGSPLICNSIEFVNRLKERRPEWDIRLAMRYGQPSLKRVFENWLNETSEPIEVVPLYPQYAKSSTGTCWDLLYELASRNQALDRVRVLQDFYGHPALTGSFARNLAAVRKSFQPDYVLFSFHGLPEHHVTELDLSGGHCLKKDHCCHEIQNVNRRCYRAQCVHTARAIAGHLKLSLGEYQIGFQSRLGRRPWIQPYTDVLLRELAEAGKKRLLVCCPSFVADCLETLEEIEVRAKEDFCRFGGEDLKLVPSLNSDSSWVDDFAAMIDDNQLEWRGVSEWTSMSITRNS